MDWLHILVSIICVVLLLSHVPWRKHKFRAGCTVKHRLVTHHGTMIVLRYDFEGDIQCVNKQGVRHYFREAELEEVFE